MLFRSEESELANSYDANAIASLLTHMGDWLVRHHSSIAFSNVYCFEYDEEIDDLYLCRNKHPKWRMRIDDYMAKKQFADSLKKAAEWLLKSPDNG